MYGLHSITYSGTVLNFLIVPWYLEYIHSHISYRYRQKGKTVYSRPLKNRFELRWATYTWNFFNKHTVSSCIPGFHISRYNQPQIENSIFYLWLGIHGGEGQYMHCSTPFRIRDLSIWGLGHLQGFREPIFCRFPGI